MADVKYIIAAEATMKGMTEVEKAFAQLEQQARKMGITSGKISGQFKVDANTIIKATGEMTEKGFKRLRHEIIRTTTSTKKAIPITDDFIRALRRVAIVVPVWMVFRAIIQSTIRAIREGWQSFREFEKEMGRVATVTKATGATIEEFNKLKQQAILYAQRSTASFKDTATAIYQLATAGIVAKDVLEGFDTVLDLAIGTMNDVNQTGKLLAGAYKLFGDQIDLASGAAERFRRISDIIAYTF